MPANNSYKPKSALIVVDLQNDFLPGGPLAVKEGDTIIPMINDLVHHQFDVKVATKDWHPKDHGSFASSHNKKPGEIILLEGIEQILWPEHCIQGTKGSEFATGWDTNQIERIFYKGIDKTSDSYSTFFDNGHRRTTGLADYLKSKKISDIYIAGLATDYCVKYSVLDARRLGFNTYVITDACRGVNLKSDDSKQAFEEMHQAGAHLISLQEALKNF
jgi:nicotinamidase/pyrazinamidase